MLVGRFVLVGRGVRVGVLDGVGEGPGVAVQSGVSVGMAVAVSVGSAVAGSVGDGVAVMRLTLPRPATAVGVDSAEIQPASPAIANKISRKGSNFLDTTIPQQSDFQHDERRQNQQPLSPHRK